MLEKTCTRCNEVKPIPDGFYRDATKKDGFSYWCKLCVAVPKKIYNAKYHEENRKSQNDGRRARYWKRRDKELEKMREYQRINVVKLRAIGRAKHREDPRVNMLANAKMRAKKKDIEFSITINDLPIPDRCPVLGVRFVIGEGVSHQFSPALDRIDNHKGYIKGNVIIVSHKVNTAKNNCSPEELVRIADFYSRRILLEAAE